MAIIASIGPQGQPPVTTYTYDLGAVTLSARPATVRSAADLATITKSIRLFRDLVVNSDTPVIATPGAPLIYRWLIDEDTPSIATCRYRCAGFNGGQVLTVDATQDLVTRETSFEARPERVISWGDFDLFFRWMTLLTELAAR